MDNIETICANSYRNFHVKGFDYLCIKRSETLTRKVYFFDGDLSQLPEIVMPHDHRYDFYTDVINGVVENKTYRVGGDVAFNRFAYSTPLNGGDGFEWVGEERLEPLRGRVYRKGQGYCSSHDDIHTLRIHAPGTVIVLDQEEDLLPVGRPTNAWKPDKAVPSLDGLYDRMTPDHARARLGQYRALLG